MFDKLPSLENNYIKLTSKDDSKAFLKNLNQIYLNINKEI